MMIRSLWSGATGMLAQQFNMDTIANDLANINTAGYRARHVSFSDLIYQNLRASGIQAATENYNPPVGMSVGLGVRVNSATPIMTRGSFMETGVWSHMAITDVGGQANEFFAIQMPNGTKAYTRDGHFMVDNEGVLRTMNGLKLFPSIEGIPADAKNPSVSQDGVISWTDKNGNVQQAGTRIKLYSFINPSGLESIGDNFWAETKVSGTPVEGTPSVGGFGGILGGWIETSNVTAITEMVNMIKCQRAYEMNSKSIQTSDEMLQTVNTLKR